MTYAVRIAPAAIRQLRMLDPVGRRRVQAAIDLLAEDPRPPAARQLVGGAGEWRVRTGDVRIIYEIHDSELVVLVVKGGHRRERSCAGANVAVRTSLRQCPAHRCGQGTGAR